MHPPEPIYPCYLPVLGEFNRMTPHEGPSSSLPEVLVPFESNEHAPCSRQGMDMFLGVEGIPLDMLIRETEAWTCSTVNDGSRGTCSLFEPRSGHMGIMSGARGEGSACPVGVRGEGGRRVGVGDGRARRRARA